MKRPTVSVTVRDEGGTLLHSEVRAALNSGVRASEDAVRQIARSQGVNYHGDKPTRIGDVYTRRWSSPRGAVVATIDKGGGSLSLPPGTRSG